MKQRKVNERGTTKKANEHQQTTTPSPWRLAHRVPIRSSSFTAPPSPIYKFVLCFLFFSPSPLLFPLPTQLPTLLLAYLSHFSSHTLLALSSSFSCLLLPDPQSASTLCGLVLHCRPGARYLEPCFSTLLSEISSSVFTQVLSIWPLSFHPPSTWPSHACVIIFPRSPLPQPFESGG